ncbi:MAG: hypothetical protein Q7S50_02460 [bacterium]|nr:hypothetical protein [bacterium]
MTLGIREEIKALAMDVDGLLTAHVKVDNELATKSSGFLSIFRAIDFGSLREKSGSILKNLRNTEGAIRSLDTKGQVLTEPQNRFIELLEKYASALISHVELFLKMISDLEARSQNNGNVTLGSHMDNSRKYKESAQDYLRFGSEMNELFQEI